MAKRESLSKKFGDMGVEDALKVDIDGKTLELDVYASDVTTFMLMGQNEGEMTEEHMQKLEDTIRRILYRSYLPYYDIANDRLVKDENLPAAKAEEQEEEKQFIENLLTRYFVDLFTGITEALGWHDGDIDKSELVTKKKDE